VLNTLIIGQDYGRDPCAVIGQLDASGRLLILGEVISYEMGLELHIQTALRPYMLQSRFIGLTMVVVGDPSGTSRSTLYEETSFDLLKRSGFNAYPAPTNDIDARLRAVDSYLMQARNAGPALMISREHCPTLISALAGGYRYQYLRTGMAKTLPDKNKFSHVADALQYLCSAAHGGLINMLSTRLARQKTPVKSLAPSPAGWT
jgi:hypothetical protein